MRSLLCTVVLFVGACEGNVGARGANLPTRPRSTVTPTPSLSCDAPQVSVMPFTHLTRGEYDLTIRDLLGLETSIAEDFAADQDTHGYEVGARVSPTLAEQYRNAAETLADEAVTQRLAALLPCSAAQGESCAREFARTFGRRAWRRSLTTAEVEALVGLFRVGAETDFPNGINMIIRGALTSPHFLYHVELAPPASQPGTILPLDGPALASRLSYFLWSSMPDDALLDAAEAGQLATEAGVEAQARRMLSDPRAQAGARNFMRQWLDLDRLTTLERDRATYPAFANRHRGELRTSLERFVDSILWSEAATLGEMLTRPRAYLNGSLATLVGVGGVSGPAIDPVDLDPSRRAGLLSQPGLLAILAKPRQSDPVHRGLFVRQRLLCQDLPPPPDDVALGAPDPNPNLSTRQRFEAHRSEARCASCHELIDPIGFGFEHYDAVGAYRDTEGGHPVDASGELNFTEDIDGTFTGVVQLSDRLSQSAHVRGCMATQWFRYALRRTETDWETCSLNRLKDQFEQSGGDLQALMVGIATSEAFRFQQVPLGLEVQTQ